MLQLKDIKYVRSHAQAIGQCQKIIMKNNIKQLFQLIPQVLQKNLQMEKIILSQL